MKCTIVRTGLNSVEFKTVNGVNVKINFSSKDNYSHNTHKIKKICSFILGNREVTAVMVKQNLHCNKNVMKKVDKKTDTPFASNRKA